MAGKRKSASSARAARKADRGDGDAGTQRPLPRRILKWGLIGTLVLALIGGLGFAWLYVSIDIPDPNEEFLTETTHVYYSNGKNELGSFAVQRRDPLAFDEMPDVIKDAVVAAENQSFWTDEGIDPKGILRAAFSNAKGNATQGASTITQQYVKLLYLTQERTWKRKAKEAILSLKVQNRLSKEEVLEGYLNMIYFGRGAYGIQAAAKAYFGVDAKQLKLKQAAVLAAILNNPGRFDPSGGKEARAALQDRYAYVLTSMADMDVVPAARAEKAARALPKFPKIAKEDAYGGQKGHVLTMVRSELRRLGFSDQEIDGGGLEVTTTFTRQAMGAAEEGVKEARPEGFSDKELHVGVASVEPGSGAVRGIFGGQDYLQSQLNWAIAGGQAGSTFKPFALAAGIKAGFSLKDTFDGNSPYLLPDGSDVENQGDEDYGSNITMLTATEHSVNTAYIDMTLGLNEAGNGPQMIIDQAEAMGIPPKEAGKDPYGFPTETPGLEPVTGVALGSQTVSPINMANGYATIANGGEAAEPYIIEKVVDSDGKTRYDHKNQTHRALDEDMNSDVSYALQQTVEASGATAYKANLINRPAGAKTGTATKTGGAVSSAWFVGFTPQLSTAVMYVRGDGTGQLDGWLPSFFGGAYPADTWVAVMNRAMDGLPVESLPEPAYTDGEAPTSGHAPYVPPTNTPKPQPKPKPKPKPSTPETTEPSEPETSKSSPGGGGSSDTGEPTDPTVTPPNQDRTRGPQQRRRRRGAA